MDVEDYFIIALVFAIVAFLSLLMRSNPFNMFYNTDNFSLGFTTTVYSVQRTSEIFMYNIALSTMIFIASAYFTIAFAIGGIVKTVVRKARKKEGKT
jgi:hypothetical protein